MKYQKDIASARLKKRRAIEEAWQRWDDYQSQDPYLVVPRATADDQQKSSRMNPLYGDVEWKLEETLRLLSIDAEWGIEKADGVVGEVEDLLARYQELARIVGSWKDVWDGPGAEKMLIGIIGFRASRLSYVTAIWIAPPILWAGYIERGCWSALSSFKRS